MAVWTNIPNANLAAGAPIRSVDTIALRDNIIFAGGIRGQVFTSSGTFTVPPNVEVIKVQIVGGGGGGANGQGSNGGAGGTTSFGAFLSATGGAASQSGMADDTFTTTAGGTGSGGDINITGGVGIASLASFSGSASGGGAGGGNPTWCRRATVAGDTFTGSFSSPGNGILGGCGGINRDSLNNFSPTGFGNGGSFRTFNQCGTSGAGAGYAMKYITGLTPGQTIAVTIGAGGTSAHTPGVGRPGICIIEW